MGNTCTSAKTDSTIRTTTEQSNATKAKPVSEENPTVLVSASQEARTTSNQSSGEAPALSTVEIQQSENATMNHVEENNDD